jgi:hypothetical protein
LIEKGAFSRNGLIGAGGSSPALGEAFVAIEEDGRQMGYVSVCVDRTESAPQLDRTLFLVFLGFAGIVILLAACSLWLVRQYFKRQGDLEQNLRKVVSDLSSSDRRANIGHWWSDIGSDKVHWSDGMFAVTDCDPETVIPTKETALSCIVPAERQNYQKTISHLMEVGGDTSFETKLI